MKAAYSIFSQAVKTSVAQNGKISSWNIWTDTTSKIFLQDFSSNAVSTYLMPYLSGAKKISGYDAKTMSSNNVLFWSSNHVYSINNGMTFSMYLYASSYYSEAYICVDINGIKKPNIVGRDIFVFCLDPNKNELVLCGSGESRQKLLTHPYRLCAKSGGITGLYLGMFCGALIALDGWQIKDDYPW